MLKIVLEEGNLMRKNGTVLSRSPFDRERAKSYSTMKDENLKYPDTTPETVLVYWGMEFKEPGVKIMPLITGESHNFPITLKIENMDTGEIKTVENYDRQGLSREQLDTTQRIRKMTQGVYKLTYLVGELSAVRYVKVRYLRGDANMDGTISARPSQGNYVSEFEAISKYHALISNDFIAEDGTIDHEFVDHVLDVNNNGEAAGIDASFLLLMMQGKYQYIPDFIPVGIGQFPHLDWFSHAMDQKQDKAVSKIVPAEGNLMRRNGTVLSLSPYDIEKAATYLPLLDSNEADPTTTPETVLVYSGQPFVDPGVTVYDAGGFMSKAPIKVTVTDMETGISKTVENYNGRTLSAEMLNTSKRFRKLENGVFKLVYSAEVDGEKLTAVRYVKLRYLRGDVNMDGKISTKGSNDNKGDLEALQYVVMGEKKNFEYETGKIDNDFLYSVCDLDRSGSVNANDLSDLNFICKGTHYQQDFAPIADCVPDIKWVWSQLDKKQDKIQNKIMLAEGNLMRRNGTVLSLSPHDIAKAATYDVTEQENAEDPTTTPETVLIYSGQPFVDPGVTVYDAGGFMSKAPIKVTVTDMETGISKTEENYNGRTLSEEMLNTSKRFRKLENGVFKLVYSAEVDGEELTAERYVKLRYPRGDANMDGTLSAKESQGSYKSDLDCLMNYVNHFYEDFEYETGNKDSDFVRSVCDINRDDSANVQDVQALQEAAYFNLPIQQDFDPVEGEVPKMDWVEVQLEKIRKALETEAL